MTQESQNFTRSASIEGIEEYVNLDDLGRECVDFVRGLTGSDYKFARGYLRLMDEATSTEVFDSVDMDLLRLVVANIQR